MNHLALGMAAYRSGDDAVAQGALLDAAKGGPDNYASAPTAAFYGAMGLFRRGKRDEARKLALEAVAKMKPLPADEKNPPYQYDSHGDLIVWLAYKEAKAMIKFEAAPPPKEAGCR
jgi:hypothetical protein